ncbi:hypothetical protein DYH09_08275 [bacterium CPR1]|nr:hypothetical protein [bacterium CPR1]
MKRVILILLLALSASGQELTLDQARQQAVKNSNVLREYRAREAESGYQVDEAYTLGNPTLGLTANTNYLTPTVTVPFGPVPTQITENFNYSVGISLRQAIYTFGRLHWRTQAAELAQRARREDLSREQNRVLEEVTLAYLEVLKSQDRVSLAEANLKARQEGLQNARSLLANGAAPRFDLVRDEAALAQAQEGLLEARNLATITRATLFSLMGRPDDGSQLAVVEEDEAPPQDLQAAKMRALATRPELAALTWSVEAARARIQVAESEDNPSLGFETSYQRRNPVGFNKADQWVTGLVLTIPLFDGGVSEARAGQAEEVVKQLEAMRDEAVRLVSLDLERLSSDLTTRHQRVEVARKGLEQAEEAARVARLRYQEGISVNVELLDTESALTRARLDLLNARYDYLGAWTRWRRATSQPPFLEAARED